MMSAYELITRNLQEVIGDDELQKILSERQLSIYWGTATTGRPHIAYFLPILKIRDFLLAGCEVKILLADIHAFLDNLKAPFETIESRTRYYEKIIKAMLLSIGVNINNLEERLGNIQIGSQEGEINKLKKNLEKINIDEDNLDKKTSKPSKLIFVKGSDYQKTAEYTLDLYKICTLTSERDAKKAGSQVVKQVSNPLLSAMIYPSMQALDEEYLRVDAQFGGVDQRKIFTYAMKYLPLLGYKKRIHLMNPMIPGLNSEKMSASDQFSKIDLLEDTKSIRKKINKCFCEEGNKENGILYLMKYIVFPIMEIRGKKVVIKRKDMDDLECINFEMLERLFENRNLHPSDLKKAVAVLLNEILEPIRNAMLDEKELIREAYQEKKK